MEIKKNPKNIKYVLLGVIAVLMIAAGVTVILDSRSNNGEELISHFEKAVNEGDVKTLEGMIQGDKNQKISKQNIEDLIKISKVDPVYLEEVVFLMETQLMIIESNEKVDKMDSSLFKGGRDLLNTGNYYITKEDGFFSSYQIKARPYSLTVSSSQEDAVIKINNAEILKTNKNNTETTVNVAPGIYKIHGIKKYEFTDIETIEEIQLFRGSTFDESVSLDLSAEGREIQITSYLEDVSIFIDGEDTEKKAAFLEDEFSYLEDKNKKFFGPFPFDESVTVHGELNLPWGIEKGEPFDTKILF